MDSFDRKQIQKLRKSSRVVFRELGLLQEDYRECGLTTSECHVLFYLAGCPGLTVGDLAEQVHLDQSTLSRLVAGMMAKGWLAVEKDPDDGRRRLLSVTDVGLEVMGCVDDCANVQIQSALACLDQADREMVLAGMELYAKALEKARSKQNQVLV